MKIQCIKKWVISIVGFAIMWTAWNALACVATAVADPVVAGNWHPIQPPAADASMQLFEQYGWFWGGALLLSGLGGWLLKRNESEHWLARGRTLVAVSAGLSVLGALLEWRLNGAPIAGVLVTLVMAVKLLWSPTVTPPAQPPDPPPGPLPAIVSGTITTKDGGS